MLVNLNGKAVAGMKASQVIKGLSSLADTDRKLVVRRRGSVRGSASRSASQPIQAQQSSNAAAAKPIERRGDEVEVSLPRGRLRITFEDGPDGVYVDTVNDASPAKGMVRARYSNAPHFRRSLY